MFTLRDVMLDLEQEVAGLKTLAKDTEKAKKLLKERGDELTEAQRKEFEAAFYTETDENRLPEMEYVLAHCNRWRWFDVGEYHKTAAIMSTEELCRHVTGEKLPFPFTTLTGYLDASNDSRSDIEWMQFALFCNQLEQTIESRLLVRTSFKDKTIHNRVKNFTYVIKLILFPENGEWQLTRMTEGKELCLFGKVVLGLLKILACKNVYVHKYEVDEKLQKRRKREGKLPGYTRHELQVKNSLEEQQCVDYKISGTHASPRLHFRRGHIRRLTGGTVWVRDCMVGKPDLGVVEKSYKI